MLRTVPQGRPLARPRARSLHWRDPAMPELPDVTVYLEALAARVGGARLERIRLANPFVLRSVDPPPAEVGGPHGDRRPAPGQADRDRAGGRALRAHPPDDRGAAALEGRRARSCPARSGWPRFDFSTGTLTLTEAGSEAPRRHPPGPRRGRAGAPTIRGGLELWDADAAAFRGRARPRVATRSSGR